MSESPSPNELGALQLDYLLDVKEKIELIRSHCPQLRQNDGFKSAFPLLLFVSHQLKGSGGTLGFPEISLLARRLHDELNRFIDPGQTPPSAPELAEGVSVIASELDSSVMRAEEAVRSSARLI